MWAIRSWIHARPEATDPAVLETIGIGNFSLSKQTQLTKYLHSISHWTFFRTAMYRFLVEIDYHLEFAAKLYPNRPFEQKKH